jgi:hypothetical protein
MLRQFARIVTVVLLLIAAFVAGQHFARPVAAQSPRPAPPKWEYRIVGSLHTVEQINKLGDEGWEALTLNASNRVLLRRAK